MEYLRPEKYYNDFYDLLTIKECLRIRNQFSETSPSLQKIKASEKEKYRAKLMVYELFLYYTKGNNYRDKEKTIRKWIQDDQLRDEKLANTPSPSGILCDYCDKVMNLEDRDLYDIEVEKLRVLFFYKCPDCGKRKAIFEDREEFKHDNSCPKCKSGKIKSKYSRKGNIITTIESCSLCDYKAKEVMDLDKNKERRIRQKELDKKLLEKYREEYCLSEKEGQEYIAETEKLKVLMNMFEEQKEKEKNPAYKKAKKLKKLTALQSEKLLKKVLEKEKYINLQFDKPQIDRFVIIHFISQDNNSKRKEYDSRNNLKKLIKKTLEKTNWRLMSDGINYRLGYLNGKLKGYEREEDLIKLIPQK